MGDFRSFHYASGPQYFAGHGACVNQTSWKNVSVDVRNHVMIAVCVLFGVGVLGGEGGVCYEIM